MELIEALGVEWPPGHAEQWCIDHDHPDHGDGVCLCGWVVYTVPK